MSFFIDPHIHMISRVTDDYQRMAQCGCVAVSRAGLLGRLRPRHRRGLPRLLPPPHRVEPKRAAQFGIQHYCWLCINAKEAENVRLSREVIALIPEFLEQAERPRHRRDRPEQEHRATRRPSSRNTSTSPMKTDELILIHTPHLEDKYKGTRMIVDMLKNDRARRSPSACCIDHVEEHTVRLALDNGFWCGMTLYPTTKCTPARAVRHHRDGRHRPHHGELGRRLGQVRPAGGAGADPGDEAPRPRARR